MQNPHAKAAEPVCVARKWAAVVAISAMFGAFVVASPITAAAKIRCQGIFQVNKTGLVSTQICRDRQIARVARSYGWRVTDAEVRNKPLKKVQICRALGGDTRLQGACGAYNRQNFF
ncbi:MAG: hypothetical protein QNJ62_07830 [Methyloceanibacter sp.]|nr:hypothetical protein [Methyloceanibacter sp.]